MSLIQGDRVVLSGYHAGSHFPQRQAELAHRLELNGSTAAGPFHIAGSVYGRDLRVLGPGTVHGPVLVRGDAVLGETVVLPQRFLAGLFVNGNLMTARSTRPLQRDAGIEPDLPLRVIRGDVVARNARLDDTLVFGNVEANHVDLTRTIVFGAVIAHEKAILRAATALYYHAPEVEFEGPCMMIAAMGESVDPPVFAPYEDPSGRVWDADVQFYPVLRAQGYDGLMWRPWTWNDPRSGRLYPGVDWLPVQVEAGGSAQRETRHVLSIAGRALNFVELSRHLEEIRVLLRQGLEFTHYSPETQQAVMATWARLGKAERGLMLRACLQQDGGI